MPRDLKIKNNNHIPITPNYQYIITNTNVHTQKYIYRCSYNYIPADVSLIFSSI